MVARTNHETVIGYDGNGYTVGDRVELHPSSDLWMRGARYGTVVGMVPTRDDKIRVRLDKLPNRVFSGSAGTFRYIGKSGSKFGCEHADCNAGDYMGVCNYRD